MEAALRRKTVPVIVWVILGIIVTFLGTYPFLFKPIKDTPATEDQSFPEPPTPPNEPRNPSDPRRTPQPKLDPN